MDFFSNLNIQTTKQPQTKPKRENRDDMCITNRRHPHPVPLSLYATLKVSGNPLTSIATATAGIRYNDVKNDSFCETDCHPYLEPSTNFTNQTRSTQDQEVVLTSSFPSVSDHDSIGNKIDFAPASASVLSAVETQQEDGGGYKEQLPASPKKRSKRRRKAQKPGLT